MRYLIIFLAITLASCSAQKKLTRLQEKHPELFVAKTDTIIDTLYVPALKADTVFDIDTLQLYDTVTVKKDSVIIKVVKQKGNVIRVTAECPPEKTITKTINKEVFIPKIVYKEQWSLAVTRMIGKGILWLAGIIALIFGILVAIKMIMK